MSTRDFATDYSGLCEFYKGKKVFITGHTGFKGTWMTHLLLHLGAEVVGYSLPAPTVPSLYELDDRSRYEQKGLFRSVTGDIRDLSELSGVVREERPDVLFHLAAQPIVRDSYRDPVYTYETNVMGTVNFLESVRLAVREGQLPLSVVVITTDKVYKNEELTDHGFREEEPLDGFDPYSNSKSCAELAVHSYRSSFFSKEGGWIVPISTVRAGNVIGGGDFANDRIIPDCVRTLEQAVREKAAEAVISVRNPYSTRPYQHVLEPLVMYLSLAAAQAKDPMVADWYNVGPDDMDCVTTGELVTLFCQEWNEMRNGLPEARWEDRAEKNAPHEAGFLKLDSSKIKRVLGYRPQWHIAECMKKTAEFSKVYITDKQEIAGEMDRQIRAFFGIK